MKSDSRRGDRKTRSELNPSRKPSFEFYLVVTDTRETEENYLLGIKSRLPQELADRLSIQVKRVLTQELLDTAIDMRNKDPQYRKTWIVFDRDRVVDFNNIIRSAEAQGVYVGWSNWSIEIWFNAYFGSMPASIDPHACEEKFKRVFKNKVGQSYEKNDKHIYQKLVRYGDEEAALQIARNRHNSYTQNEQSCKPICPSDMASTTTMYLLVQELTDSIKNVLAR